MGFRLFNFLCKKKKPNALWRGIKDYIPFDFSSAETSANRKKHARIWVRFNQAPSSGGEGSATLRDSSRSFLDMHTPRPDREWALAAFNSSSTFTSRLVSVQKPNVVLVFVLSASSTLTRGLFLSFHMLKHCEVLAKQIIVKCFSFSSSSSV